MARLIRHDATGPYEVKPSAESTWVCMCGLSKNYPLCDGSHKLCRKHEAAGKLYTWHNDTPTEIGEDKS